MFLLHVSTLRYPNPFSVLYSLHALLAWCSMFVYISSLSKPRTSILILCSQRALRLGFPMYSVGVTRVSILFVPTLIFLNMIQLSADIQQIPEYPVPFFFFFFFIEYPSDLCSLSNQNSSPYSPYSIRL